VYRRRYVEADYFLELVNEMGIAGTIEGVEAMSFARSAARSAATRRGRDHGGLAKWAASPGGSLQVYATIAWTMPTGISGLPDFLTASWSKTIDTSVGETLCQHQKAGQLAARKPLDPGDVQLGYWRGGLPSGCCGALRPAGSHVE